MAFLGILESTPCGVYDMTQKFDDATLSLSEPIESRVHNPVHDIFTYSPSRIEPQGFPGSRQESDH